MDKPLEGIVILEFAQFMAGPTAGLRLADLGARVIKIERPGQGESGRQIAIKNLFVDDSSLVFHTINRNKESFAADLKNPEDLSAVKALVSKADVVIHNFRPGIMERLGLDYGSVQQLKGDIVYAQVTGYGSTGLWAAKPGQDLLIQSLSGLTWLSGSRSDGPVPFGLAMVDMYCATHLTQGVLAGLIKRRRTGKSVLVEVSLMEAALDMQFEVLTTHFADGKQLPQRSAFKGAGHAYLSAPYGVYNTKDAYVALAMCDLEVLGRVLGIEGDLFTDRKQWFSERDEIMSMLAAYISNCETMDLLERLEKAGIWCATVNDHRQFLESGLFEESRMLQEVRLVDGTALKTTRSVFCIDGAYSYSKRAAPKVGQDNEKISQDFFN